MDNLYNDFGHYTKKQAIDIAVARLILELSDTIRVTNWENTKPSVQLERASDLYCQFVATLPKKCKLELVDG